MGYTPNSEEIHEELEMAVEAIKALTHKLRNRAIVDMGDWNDDHKEECLAISNDLDRIVLKLSKFN